MIDKIQEEILDMVKNKFPHIKGEIDIDASLKDEYSLNSFSMIQMFVEIEMMYDIGFEDEQMNFEKFQNLRSIIEYVHIKLN